MANTLSPAPRGALWRLVGLALVAGCVETGIPPITGGLRVVNAITNESRQPVHIRIDGSSAGESIPFLGVSQIAGGGVYHRLTPGVHNVTLKWATDTSVIVASYSTELDPFEERTLYATGSGGFVASETSDANGPPPAGTVRMRVVNFSITAGPSDVYVTAPNADLATALPQAAALSAGEASQYFFVNTGTYQIRFVPAGTAPAARASSVTVNIAPQTWTGGGRTIVATEALGGGAAIGTVLVDQ